MPGPQPQHGADLFTESVVRHGDHHRLGDLGHAEEQLLHLERADVLATANDDVGFAIRDREVTVRVQDADIAGVVPAIGVEDLRRQRFIEIPYAQVRPPAQDFAIFGQPDLDTGHRPAVGRQPFEFRRVEQRPGDRRMFGAAVGTESGDAESGQPAGDRERHRRPAEPEVLHPAQMFRGEIGMLEQTRHEIRWTAADREAVVLHQRQRPLRIPGVGEVDRLTVQHRDDERADHSDEMTDRCGGQLDAAVTDIALGQLPGLAPERLMTVHHRLGRARGARGEGDQRRRGRIGAQRAGHRLVGEQLFEIAPDHADHRDVGADIGFVDHPAEALGGDEDARPGGLEDVREFLAPVEVHDRHDRGAEEGRRPEGGRRFHPVG